MLEVERMRPVDPCQQQLDACPRVRTSTAGSRTLHVENNRGIHEQPQNLVCWGLTVKALSYIHPVVLTSSIRA